MTRPSTDSLRFLLLQVRDLDDPMRVHELHAFAQTLEADADRFTAVDLLSTQPTARQLDATDVVLLGGSGNFSAAGEGDWLERSLDMLRELVIRRQPTFASCWGFQAMARALGGTVIHDPGTAEVGTHELFLTGAGQRDPVFGPLGPRFLAQMGHEDCVSVLPDSATLLACSQRNKHQAYYLNDAPIYCTQFHPELARRDLQARVEAYPQYIERIAGMPAEEFIETLVESTAAAALLCRFVETVLAG